MKTKSILIISTVLSVIILLVIGGVGMTALSNNAESAKKATQAAQEMDPTLKQAFIDREAAYQAAIAEANARLQQMNEQQKQPAQQAQLPQSPTAGQQVVDSQFAVTSEEAAKIAEKAVTGKGAPLKTSELVSLDGKSVYDVAFQLGSVYIDSASGQVLKNSPLLKVIDRVEAIRIAVRYLGMTNWYETHIKEFQGNNVYQVIFQSGEAVYVDMNGQIVLVQLPSRGGGGGGMRKAGSAQASSGGGGGGGDDGGGDDGGKDD